jgi:hypothetical protein
MRGAAFLSVFETNKEGIALKIKNRVIDLERGKRFKIQLAYCWKSGLGMYRYRWLNKKLPESKQIVLLH